MTFRAKAALSAAGLLLVATGAAGCGGGDTAKDAPASASKSDFCGALKTFETNLGKVDPTDPKAAVKTFKAEAKKLRAVGTPSNVPDDARKGYEAVLDAIDKLPDDASLDDLSKMEDDFSDADKKNSEAFDTYLKKECPELQSAG